MTASEPAFLNAFTHSNIPMPSLIGLHLDLKGVQFRPEYLPQLIEDAAAQGINALLVEYEDVFPFAQQNIADDASAVWTPEFLSEFLAVAQSHGVEIIPLQQCLGHLEYVLRHEPFAPFALDPAYPSTLDISNPAARELVFSLLDQIIESHPDSRFVHLGMDEAHALIAHAQRNQSDVVALFLDWLDELCQRCERAGKTPLIFSDMLEDHLSPASLPLFEAFRDRVVLCPWDYSSRGKMIQIGRICGPRASRQWRAEPGDPDAPPLAENQKWIEDLAPEIAELIEPYRRERGFLPMFQADLWTALGFRVFGATAVRASADGVLLPDFNRRRQNIEAWARAIERTGSRGIFASSWARGTTFCRPNFFFDLTWPLIGEFTRALGQNPPPFFAGVAAATVEHLMATIGRCRDNWRLEGEVIAEMEALEGQLQSHQFEWHSFILMLRAFDFERRSRFAALEVEDFAGADRLPRPEWQRRLREQTALLSECETLELAVRQHFGGRYYGAAYQEWLSAFFDGHRKNLRALREISERKVN